MAGKKRERSKKRKIISIVKKYNFEFLIAFLIFLGLFLLLEDFELKKFKEPIQPQFKYWNIKSILDYGGGGVKLGKRGGFHG